jgi:aspartate 1-decarboxylase
LEFDFRRLVLRFNTMHLSLLKSKILRAEVTDCALHYEGSLAIDSGLMEQVGLLPFEKILVGNIANGERFETYAIEAPQGSHAICLNGAAAHKGEIGDLLVIMSFAQMTAQEAADWSPRVIRLAEGNRRVLKKDELLIGDNSYSA